MKPYFCLLAFILALYHGFAITNSENMNSDKLAENHIWAKFEILLSSAKTYNNPIYEVEELKTIFTSPSGRTKVIRGFWDGGTDWKIRFQPDEIGVWTWLTSCTDSVNNGLHGRTGEFLCIKNPSEDLIYKHGAIKHEAGKYYLSYNNGTPFFWLACTAWNGALKSTDEEWEHYLNQRKENNYNVIQLVTTEWRGCDKNAEGLTAIEGTTNIRINPEFFKRIDQKIDEANAKGLVVSPVVLWALSGVGSQLNPGYSLPIKEAVLLAKYIVARYQGNQVFWTLGGDGHYIDDQELKWKEIGRLVFNDIDHAPVTLHPQGSSWVGEHFNKEDWYDLMGYQSSHDNGERVVNWINKGPMAKMWKKLKPMPYINMEPNYEEIDFRITAEDIRNASYWSIFATPIAGVTYGANGVWPWLRSGEKILNHNHKEGVTTWRESIEFPGSIQMGYLAKFIQQFEWWNLYPANEILAVQPGEKKFNHWVSVVKSPEDQTIIAYIPHKTDVVLFNPQQYQYSAKWFNPLTNKYLDATVKRTGVISKKEGGSEITKNTDDTTNERTNTIEFSHDFENDMIIVLQKEDNKN
jgi:hypothetical protein